MLLLALAEVLHSSQADHCCSKAVATLFIGKDLLFELRPCVLGPCLQGPQQRILLKNLSYHSRDPLAPPLALGTVKMAWDFLGRGEKGHRSGLGDVTRRSRTQRHPYVT